MKVINLDTGIVEFNGPVDKFDSMGGATAFEWITSYSINRASIDSKSPIISELPSGYKKNIEYQYTKEEINQFAFDQITKYYPLWKQNNILNSGNLSKIDEMYEFINRVRDWSNKPNIIREEVLEIKA